MLCHSIGITPRTLERWQLNTDDYDKRRGPKTHGKAMSQEECSAALTVMNSEPYYDFPPEVVVAKLADEGRYLCSASKMYRILRSHSMLAHRSRGKRPEYGTRIETIAKGPNEVWCWDITFLPTPIVGRYFKLYVLEDIFSRKIVGHLVAEDEGSSKGLELIEAALKSESISSEGLRVHSDNGHPMKNYTFVEKLKALGIIQSRSRPKVSDDNPFIESLFRTMKYAPEYPNRPFNNIEAARAWVKEFIDWYNNKHLHSGIDYVTPSDRHTGAHIAILTGRREVFLQARNANPKRWSQAPYAWTPAETVELNSAGCRMTK